MSISKIFITIVYALILMSSTLYAWHLLLNKTVNFKDSKLYVTLIGLMFTSIINYIVINRFVKITIMTLILIIFFKYLFKEKWNKTIITPIYTQIIIFFDEFIYTLILLLIFGNQTEQTIKSTLGIFVTNVTIAILLYISVRFKFVKKLYKTLLKITDKINSVQLSLFCIVGVLILNILLSSSYNTVKVEYILIFNVSVTLLVLAIIFYSFKTQNKYNKVSNKYNVAIKSLNDYENMMTKYRVANHENKNLLLTVRAMIINKDKDIPKYIDSIIEEKYLDDEKLLFEVNSIPSGGLRATIYSEILKIKENEISYFLNIDRNIRTVDLIELDTDTIIDICKIIGVFIDNAIDEVKNLKQKNINIELYLDNDSLCIKVSNNYKGSIDISKIDNEGYTTKGKGHGYGLALVKNIVKSNVIFDQKTEISKNIFSQNLIIKYKKS